MIIVDEDQGTIVGFPKLRLAADHSHMNKFSSPDDENYRNVVYHLKDMIDRAPARVEARLKREPVQVAWLFLG